MGPVTALDELLELQALDTSLDQLAHKRETLPQRGEIVDVTAKKKSGEGVAETVFGQLREKQSAQKALEDESALTGDKASAIDTKMYDGSVTDAKDLEAFQAEATMLRKRGSELDDRVLELMEEVDPIEEQLESVRSALAEIDVMLAELAGSLASDENEIDAEVQNLTGSREQLVGGLAEDIVSEYESLRRGLGGVGAARLVGNHCEGCHLEIPSADSERLRAAPADAVVNCPECGRILVR